MSLASIRAFGDLWLLSELVRRERALMAIELIEPYNVYVDESVQYADRVKRIGSKSRELYAVTAYVAKFDNWITLENEWQGHLDYFKSPPFHFTDFMSRKGDFSKEKLNWSDKQRNDYLELLCITAANIQLWVPGVEFSKMITKQPYPKI